MALAIAACGHAQQIILTSSNVIGGGATVYSGTWNAGAYNALAVVDAQTGTVADNNSTPAGGPFNYWLPPDSTVGASAYFVLNLGAPYVLSQIDLFNTRNAGMGDRATTTFSMLASNATSWNSGTNGYDLSGTTVTILTGTLPAVGDYNNITAATFTAGTSTALTNIGTAYQFLQFTATGYTGAYGAGLNEIRVYGTAIPEPSTYAALLGAIAAGVAAWRRRATDRR